MVEFFGTLKRSRTVNGTQEMIFNIPAFSRRLAKQRARGNARAKGLRNFAVNDPEKVGSGDVPGQSIYEVVVRA